MTELMALIFLAELGAVAVCLGMAAAWTARRRRRRILAAIEGLLDRVAADEPERIARRARLLQAACHAAADNAATAARDMSTAEREFIRTLLAPLLGADPDYPKGLDENLHRFADGQVEIVARLLNRGTDRSGTAGPAAAIHEATETATDTPAPHTERLQPAETTHAAPAAGDSVRREAVEGMLPPLPGVDDTPWPLETVERHGDARPSAGAADEETAAPAPAAEISLQPGPVEDLDTVSGRAAALTEFQRRTVPQNEAAPPDGSGGGSKPRRKKKKDAGPAEGSGDPA